MKVPVIRKNGKVRIDVLAVREAARRGTLSDTDRATVERILPGVIGSIENENKPVLLPNASPKE